MAGILATLVNSRDPKGGRLSPNGGYPGNCFIFKRILIQLACHPFPFGRLSLATSGPSTRITPQCGAMLSNGNSDDSPQNGASLCQPLLLRRWPVLVGGAHGHAEGRAHASHKGGDTSAQLLWARHASLRAPHRDPNTAIRKVRRLAGNLAQQLNPASHVVETLLLVLGLTLDV